MRPADGIAATGTRWDGSRLSVMVDSLPMPGVAMGLVSGDSLVYSKGGGTADHLPPGVSVPHRKPHP